MTANRVVRILGIDPGSRITGFGVVDIQVGQVAYVDCGCVRADADDMAIRLHQIHTAIAQVVAQHQPHELAIEKVFVHRNVSSALKLGQARGAALVAVVAAGIAVHEYSPNEIKQAITGRGHADKQQVQHMVRMLLGLRRSPASDAADALAVAICHGHTRETRQRIDLAMKASQ